MSRCILCLEEFPSARRSIEHIFPESIGGTITTDALCVDCNAHLGRTADAYLVDHQYMQWARRRYLLGGKSGRVPNPLDKGRLVAEPEQRLRWENGGRVYYHPSVSVDRDGTTVVAVDASDQGQLAEIVAKVKARGAQRVRTKIRAANSGAMEFDVEFDSLGYRLGLIKIVYELTVRVLGPAYLEDKMAAKFRSLLTTVSPSPGCNADLKQAGVVGDFGGLYERAMRRVPPGGHAWLVGVVYPLRVEQRHVIITYVRLFDRFDAMFLVAEPAFGYAIPDEGCGWFTDMQTGETRSMDLAGLRDGWAATEREVGAK